MIVKKAALLGIGRPVEFPVEFKGFDRNGRSRWRLT